VATSAKYSTLSRAGPTVPHMRYLSPYLTPATSTGEAWAHYSGLFRTLPKPVRSSFGFSTPHSASYALSSSWNQKSSERPSARRTSNAGYSGCPHVPSTVPSMPQNPDLRCPSFTRTLIPGHASRDSKTTFPFLRARGKTTL
jgi:hypothetical protein